MDILLLVHLDLIPPDDANPAKINRDEAPPWITELDVKSELIKLGHDVSVLGLYDDIQPLVERLQSNPPDVVFNLLEEFESNPRLDYQIVSLLELMHVPYTGCNPKGLMLARDKALAKKILRHHFIGTAQFFVLPKSKRRKLPKSLRYPMIVKCLYEEASYGIAKASVVHSEEKLLERVRYIHEKLEQDVIIEEFIEGRELFVGITGNKQLKTYPVWELIYDNVEAPEREIYSEKAKWNEKYRSRKGIHTQAAKLSPALESKVIATCKKVYHLLELSGCARIDLRVTAEDKIYVLEANPNPNLAIDDDLALSAGHAGVNYSELITAILNHA